VICGFTMQAYQTKERYFGDFQNIFGKGKVTFKDDSKENSKKERAMVKKRYTIL